MAGQVFEEGFRIDRLRAKLLRRQFRDQVEAVRNGRDPIAVTRMEHDVIELPLERFKFGRGAEFATQWIDRGSMKYSPQADDLKKLHIQAWANREGVTDPAAAPGQ